MSRRAALLLALLLPGCVLGGPDWYVGGVSATAGFADEAWDRERALAGLRETGFEPRPSASSVVVGGNGTWDVHATAQADGAIQLTVSYRLGEKAASKDAAEARAAAVQEEVAPRVEELMAAFERGSGWTRDGEVRWSSGVLHGD